MAEPQTLPEADAGDDLYRSIVEHALHGVAVVQDGRCVYLNAALTAMLGYPREEVLGWSTDELIARVHPDDATRIAERFRSRMQGGGAPPRTEFRVRTRAGEYHWVETHAHLARLRGRPALCVAIVDVSERKRTELELERNYQRLLGLTESAGYYVTELDDTLHYVYASPTLEAKLGFGDLIGRTGADIMRELCHPDDVAALTQQLAGLNEAGIIEPLVQRWRFEGGWRWVETVVRRVQRQGKWHVIAISRDVNERVAAEDERRRLVERLHRSEKLEALGLLAGGVAHDFNNLLMSMRVNAELALGVLTRSHPASGRVADILRAADHARSVTRQLLAYAGRGRMVIEPFDLAHAAAESAQFLSTMLPRGASLKVETEPATPIWVDGDATQIRQLVLNLLTNAGEALGGSGGAIRVRTGARELSAAELARCAAGADLAPGRYAFLEVADDGSGIDPEHIERIFDPFFTTKQKGRGLGLAGGLGVVRSHRGALRVESQVGGGTSFEIFLPLAEPPAARTEPAPPFASLGGLRAVLVVDDQEDVRVAAGRLLQFLGHGVVEAGSGREALRLFAPDPGAFDAVLLDVTMPGLTGDQTFDELRKLRPDLPVVFMSGHSEDDVRSRGRDDPRVTALAKPFSGAELSSALRAVLGKDAGS